MHKLTEMRQPTQMQQFDLYHPMAPLPRFDTVLFLPHLLTTGLHLGVLALHSLLSTWTHPPHIPSPSDWLRLFSSQTFSHINTPRISSQLFFLLTPPIKMEHTECSETLTHKIQTPLGNHPKEKIQYTYHLL